MANQIEERLSHILKLLAEATQVEFYRDMRRRFASDEQWKREGPEMERHAAVCWFAAKHAIGEDREALDKHLRENKDKMSQTQVNTYLAALQVIDKEIETQFEQQFLKEETVAKRIPLDQDLFEEEVEELEEEFDEDEDYVRETTEDLVDDEDLLWDEDDYLGDEDDFEDDVE